MQEMTPFEMVKSRLCQEIPSLQDAGMIVAVSGGADSMALLHMLCRLRKAIPFSLLAAHVNHGLRGQEADRDAVFVAEQCDAWQVPLKTLCVDINQEKLEGEGTEQAGRRIRYAFFRELQQQYGYGYIVTAHHGDDNLETVLLHLTRGSGLHGLCGIFPSFNGIIRPLLDCSREMIEQYCKEQNVPFVTDSTNTDIAYSRNRIRSQVIPALKVINPQVVEACARLTSNLREEDSFLQSLTEQLLQNAEKGNDIYDCKTLSDAPHALLRRALKTVIEQAGIDPQEKYIWLAESALKQGKGSVQLDKKTFLTVDDGCLKIEMKTEKLPYFEFTVETEKQYTVGNQVYKIRCVSLEEFENVYKKAKKFACDYDKLYGSLVMRQRKQGDYFHPVGGAGKTLKKYFNENEIPVYDRYSIPIVCDEKGVALIVGYSCDDRVKLDENTKNVLVVTGGKNP